LIVTDLWRFLPIMRGEKLGIGIDLVGEPCGTKPVETTGVINYVHAILRESG